MNRYLGFIDIHRLSILAILMGIKEKRVIHSMGINSVRNLDEREKWALTGMMHSDALLIDMIQRCQQNIWPRF
jgi:hypothetical protein